MKFSCERCGKKYATAEDPAPGRVYKLKCKACGNLIVVRPGSAKAAAPSPASSRTTPARPPGGLSAGDEAVPGGSPASMPRPDLVAEVASPAPLAPAGRAAEYVPRRDPDPTSLISMSGVVNAPEEEFKPPPGDTGYVDLFAGEVGGGEQIASEARSPVPADDPFLAAARASLPDDFPMGGEGRHDPFLAARVSPERFAGIEHATEHAAANPEPARVRPPPTVPVPEAAPGSPAKRSAFPAAVLGMGVGLVAVVALVVFIGSGPQASSPEARPPTASSRPTPALAEPLEPAREPEPRDMAPVTEAAPQEQRAGSSPELRKYREDPKPRRKEPSLAQAPKVEREASPSPSPPRAPPPSPPPEPAPAAKPRERQVSLPDVEGALTPDVVNTVLASNRKAFSACIAQAGKSPEVSLDGRRVQLRLTINPNGLVTDPTLDDVTLNSTAMGACIKDAARVMVFPKFKGDPFHAQVPLILR